MQLSCRLIVWLLALGVLVGCTPVPATPAGPLPTSTPSEILISLQRTACFGFCPAYTVTINGQGEVQYQGERCVKVKGAQSATIPPEKVRELLAAFDEIDFFSLQDEYTAQVTDLPSTTVSLTVDGRHKSVLDYYGAPEALQALEQKIDEVANTAQWVGEPSPELCE